MNISKTVTHHIRMGQYESLVIGTTVTQDVPEGAELEDVLDDVDAIVMAALEPDIRKARELAVEDSYINDWGTR